jgi:hypothetical protein
MQFQSQELHERGKDTSWFNRMIADTTISIITILGTQFYDERDEYLSELQELQIYPLQPKSLKARLINLSPLLMVKLLHFKNKK